MNTASTLPVPASKGISLRQDAQVIGQTIAPLVFGTLMNQHQFQGVFIGMALVQGVLITSAFNVGRVRRTALVMA